MSLESDDLAFVLKGLNEVLDCDHLGLVFGKDEGRLAVYQSMCQSTWVGCKTCHPRVSLARGGSIFESRWPSGKQEENESRRGACGQPPQ